jgi:hypothetical protein
MLCQVSWTSDVVGMRRTYIAILVDHVLDQVDHFDIVPDGLCISCALRRVLS